MIPCAIHGCGEPAERIIDAKGDVGGPGFGYCADHTPRHGLPLNGRCHIPTCCAPSTRIVFGKPVCANNTHRPQS